jgi:hypothetical protein
LVVQLNIRWIEYVQLTTTMKHFSAFFVAAALSWPALCGAARDSAAFPQTSAPIPIVESDAQLGRREAPLTLVVFLDYQCPYSRRFLQKGIPQLRARYGNDLRVVFKDNPLAFHADALNLATAAHGVYALAGMRAWEKFVELESLHQGAFDRETLVGLAMVAGVRDRKAFEEGLLLQTWLRQVQESQRVADRVGARATPTSYLNGLQLQGAVIDADLERRYPAIDAELAASKAQAAHGFQPIDVYGYRVKQNLDRDIDGGRTPSSPPEALPLYPEEGIGTLRLGMKLSSLQPNKVFAVRVTSPSEACLSRTSDGPCMFMLRVDGGIVTHIRYSLKTRGLTVDGVTLPPEASLERTLQVLRCGPYEVAEGGGTAFCPRHLRVDNPSGPPDGKNIWIEISR